MLGTPRLVAPAAAAPPARKCRRARATASPEPAASDASAPAERPKKRPKRAWTTAEDDKLRAAREKSISLNQGEVVWKDVAAEVGARDWKQCRERWTYQLNPEINKSDFTAEEDAYLLALPQTGNGGASLGRSRARAAGRTWPSKIDTTG